MDEQAITAKDAARILGCSGKHGEKVVNRRAARGELDGTWFYNGRKRVFIEKRLLELRDRLVQSACQQRPA